MAKRKTEEERVLLHPVETQRASEVIYEQIKSLILEGKAGPGDRLPSERAMMEQMGRSRPTIREALRMLERDGFIRIVPGTNGAIVQEMSTSQVEQPLEALLRTSRTSLAELGEYRLHNDVAVARWAAQRRTAEDVNALRAVIKRAEAFMEQEKFEAFFQMDTEFHGALAHAAKNEVAYILSQVLSRLSNPFSLNVMWMMDVKAQRERAEWVLGMHRDIFDAVEAGDPVAAEKAMVIHIQAFLDDNDLGRVGQRTYDHREKN